MNVIVSNKNQSLLNSLDIDIIKNVNGEFTAEELIQSFSNFFFNRMFLDITAIRDYANLTNIQKLSMSLDMNKIILFLDDFEVTNSSTYISSLISMGIYNFTKNKDGLMYLYNHPNNYKDVAHLHIINNGLPQGNNIISNNIQSNISNNTMNSSTFVLGFKNVTLHAGSTSLIYMIKKKLSAYKDVLAIEVNKKEFLYFYDKEMISVSENELSQTINKYCNKDIILLDLNNASGEAICNDIVYLIEPTTLKLNKLVLVNKAIFNTLKNKTVVLNQSLLDSTDISDFEFESKIKIYANIPPLNDKAENFDELTQFLNKIGID